MCRTMRCCVIDLYSYTIMHSFFPSSTHMTWHGFTSQMQRDTFPSRELSLSVSSRCSSQLPSTRRVGSGKLHSTHAWSSDGV